MANTLRTLGPVLGLLALSIAACSEPDSPDPDTGKGNGMIDRLAGQTGDEGAIGWTPPGGAASSRCAEWDEEQTLASLESDTELGFSAADILSFVAGQHEVGVHWNGRPQRSYRALRVTPSGDDTLELKISHDGEPARYRGVVPPDGGVLPPNCRGELTLGVKVTLRSESGALDEQWLGRLKADQVGEAQIMLLAPVWRGLFPGQPDRDEAHFANALEGKLDVVDADDPGSAFAWVYVALRMRPDVTDGGVGGWVQDGKGGAFLVSSTTTGADDNALGMIGTIGAGFDGFLYPWVTQ